MIILTTDEICLDPSDYPLANALNAKKPPRFVLRIDLTKPSEDQASQAQNKQATTPLTSLPNGTAAMSHVAKKPSSPNPSLVSNKSVGSSSSAESFVGFTSLGRDSATASKKAAAAVASPFTKAHTSKPSTPSASERARNFLNFGSPKPNRGMFFDGATKPEDQSAHHSSSHRFLPGRRQRKRSFGSKLTGKLKKNSGEKSKVELSTQEQAPGILKVFGDHVSPGSNYKSVRATDMTTAEEIVKQALERYSLEERNSSDFVLCDVIGYFAKKPGSAKKSTESSQDSDKWMTEYSRVIGDKEKPLVLQQLWKPDAGFSRRFELRKRIDTEHSSFFKPRGSMAVMKAASVRDTKGTPRMKDIRSMTGDSDTSSLPASIEEHFQFGSEDGGSSGRNSVVAGSCQAPVDAPYLLLIRGYNNSEDFLFHRLDEQVTVLGSHCNQMDDQRTDIILEAPDLLRQHCTLSKTVEANGSDFDSDNYKVSVVVSLEPNSDADIKVNGIPITDSLTLNPGDLISLGKHYVFVFKDPTDVADSSLTLKWMNALFFFNELQKNAGEGGGALPENMTNHMSTSVNGVNHIDIPAEPDNRLRLSYRPEDEDRLLAMITNIVDPYTNNYKLTPAYLFLMCIEHSARHHSELQTRHLLLKISNTLQTIASVSC